MVARSQESWDIVRRTDAEEARTYAQVEGLLTTLEGSSKSDVARIPPDWTDLVRLHRLIRSRRVTTFLEFGVGYSTIVAAHAMELNDGEFGEFVKARLRRANPFEVHSVDDQEVYIEATSDLLTSELAPRVTFHHSQCRMVEWEGRICTLYDAVPNIAPDFLYLDGPSQDSVIGDVRGVSTSGIDRVPMAADVLAIEHFLLPGCFLLVDGRTANARFLKANLQRQWTHEHFLKADVHAFELVEPPLGAPNRSQIEFCLGTDWPGLSLST